MVKRRRHRPSSAGIGYEECAKCPLRIRCDKLEAPGQGCTCLLCAACLKSTRSMCRAPTCKNPAVFCYDCPTGDQEGTEPLCPSCYAAEEEKEEEEKKKTVSASL